MMRRIRRALGLSDIKAQTDRILANLKPIELELDRLRNEREQRDGSLLESGQDAQSLLKRIEGMEQLMGDIQVEMSSLRMDLAREIEELRAAEQRKT